MSTINHEIREFARKNGLKPSWTFYNKWKDKKATGKKNSDGKATQLRFSKHGNENIEKLYATHYISSLEITNNKSTKTL